MSEKIVTIYIGGYPRRCIESRVEKILENIEQLKQHYLSKGVLQEVLDKMYSVRIVRDEDRSQNE